MIPKTTTYKKFKEKRARESAEEAANASRGQKSLDGRMVDSGIENGHMRERKEDSMLRANGNDGHPTHSKLPTVVHSTHTPQDVLIEDSPSSYQEPGNRDVTMTDD